MVVNPVPALLSFVRVPNAFFVFMCVFLCFLFVFPLRCADWLMSLFFIVQYLYAFVVFLFCLVVARLRVLCVFWDRCVGDREQLIAMDACYRRFHLAKWGDYYEV